MMGLKLCIYNLAAVILHQSSSNIEVICRPGVFTCHLEHGTSRFDSLGTSRKPHVLYVWLSMHTSAHN